MDQLTNDALRLLAGRFKLLASPTRLSILQHICHEERTVSQLVEATGFKQANVSRQLGMLHRGGLAKRRTQGNNVYYTIGDPSLPQLCEAMRESLKCRQGELLNSLE